MPVSYVNNTSGSQTSSSASGTLSLTALSAAPTTGQWLFVAAQSTDAANGTTITGVTCGTVSLALIDAGYSGTDAAVWSPSLYAAPYQSGMSTAITVSWGNSTGASRQFTAVALVLGGIAATPTTAYAHLRNLNANGLFDGSCGSLSTDLGSATTSVAASQLTVTGNILPYTNSAGIRTAYGAQDQPFILATWQQGAVTAPSTLNGAASISSGTITTSGQASGTVVLASATTYGTTGTAYLLTTSGVCPFSWTGKSGNNLTGCSVYGGSASGFYNYSIVNGTGASINHPVLIQTSSITAAQPINGWQMGVNATTGIGVNISTTGVTGGLPGGFMTLSFGQSLGSNSTPAYLVTETSAKIGSVLFTLVPTTRTMARTSTASGILADKANKAKTAARNALASLISASKASKVKTSNRTATATHVRAAKVSKTATFLRTAKATLINVSREARQVYYQVVSAALAVLADYDIKTVNRVKSAVATLVRTPKVSKVATFPRRASQAVIGASQAIKAATFRRSAKATAVSSVTVSKTVLRTRRANAVAVYAISSSKSRTFTRRAIATAVALVSVAKTYTPFITHPGYVSAAIETASVKSAVKTASVSSDVETASVRSQAKTATVASDVKTATVSSSVKPLV